MQDLSRDSLRHHMLEAAKKFKTSWIDLGRALYSVWKDKLYKEWGYSVFEAYTGREIGIKKQTAMKLLRSYYFLEKEDPAYLKEGYKESVDAASVPNYETLDVLRLAKNKKILDDEDYAQLKKEAFEKGKDHSQLRRDLTALIRQREEMEPQEAYEKKRLVVVKRFLSSLKALKKEAEMAKLLPAALIREAAELIQKLEAELS